MIALLIFICGVVGTGFNVTRVWSVFTLMMLGLGYPLTWLGLAVIWGTRLLLL